MEEATTVTTVTNQDLPNVNVQKEVVSTSSSVDRNTAYISRSIQVLWFVISLIEVLIIARFFLLLLGARNTEFVSFIYSLSKVFILPFTGIFASPSFEGSYFDTAAVIGFVAWIVFGFIISALIRLFTKPTAATVV